MISLEERKDILDDELDILVESGWTVVSRTETTCFLRKEFRAMGCLSQIIFFGTPFLNFDIFHRTRTIEISPEGEIIRSWLQI